MRYLQDTKRTERYIREDALFSHLADLGVHFTLVHFEKAEVIETPYTPLKSLLFIVDGQVQIYDISQEGEKIPMSLVWDGTILGDMEFCGRAKEPFFAEAVTETVCLSLPMNRNRELLMQDVEFLHCLLYSLADKLEMIGQIDTRRKNVRARVLYYMQYVYPDGILQGMERTAMQMRCSRRQLQRVMTELCEAGEVRQIGRGKYKLCKAGMDQQE